MATNKNEGTSSYLKSLWIEKIVIVGYSGETAEQASIEQDIDVARQVKVFRDKSVLTIKSKVMLFKDFVISF